jgi:hypothetical protein
MSPRMRVGAVILLVVVGFGVVVKWSSPNADEVVMPEAGAMDRPEVLPETQSSAEAWAERLKAYADDPVVGGFLDPAGSAMRDLEIMSEVFETWQSNFPGDGNPGGENHEITAALVGKNRLNLELIPADHPAINQAGELCDRWGTPLFFHQLSGEEMELRSAGADREHYTDDDVLWTP